MNKQKWPTCGLQDCNEPARFSDSAGVGYCSEHRMDAIRTTTSGEPFLLRAKTIQKFDPWWTASTVASKDPVLTEKWKDIEYGMYPTGGPWNPSKGSRE